ncbi:hypothetical protein S40285_10131 [Stachybotrys chlorohalonatus IBT 40285]|uniref:Uncharacterized protein n=1 Tax=Stachybotrys chlorohalonatus (strain IBT 40285) TaxID=1283841 RepID=A0A084QTR0_STAC4|nr:hypothetical protein S40285_10131 [Stachybotrys chlorohalonata IBT 40285]
MHLHGAFLLALAPLAHAVIAFTSPDTSQPINVSEPVVFEWTNADDAQSERDPWLELGFASGNIGVWWLNANRRIDIRNTNSWTWDAPAWAEDMAGAGQIIRAGRNNWFETHLHDAQYTNQTGEILTLETERFEVVGYPHLEGDARATTPSLILGFSAGALAIIASL